MRNRCRFGLFGVFASLLVATASVGPIRQAAAATTTLVASADSFVIASSPTANRGTVTPVRTNGDTRRIYVRFDLSTLPPGSSITSATLRLFATSPSNCSTGIEVLRSADDTWGETSITWANQPGPTGPVLATAPPWTADKWVAANVTSAVTGSVVSFVVRHAAGCTPTNDASFHSREAANKPQLVVEIAPTAPQCSDGIDNDGDTHIDHPGDPGCTGPGDADETDPPSGTTIIAEADSFVVASSPTSNRGTVTPLKVNGDSKRVYVRFDLPGLAPDESITSATLRLFASSAPNCAAGAEVLLAASNSWSETGITWNTQPGTTGGVVDTAAAWANGTYVDFDVTAATTGDGVSFVVRHASGCTPADASFHSREGVNKPTLVLETTTSEPTTTCGVSGESTICVTPPSSILTGLVTIQVTKDPSGGKLFINWVPDGGSPVYLRIALGRDPETGDHSFLLPTHKFLDGPGVLRFKATNNSAPVDVPVTFENGNTTDYQHNPSDWQSFLPGPWTAPFDPVIPAVGDGPDGLALGNSVGAMIDATNPPLALFLGDVYENGGHTELLNNYGVSALDSPNPTRWGTFADVTQPVLGNHEVAYPEAWSDYWHGRPRYTSYTFGGVLFLALDSTNGPDNFHVGTAEYNWVQAQLASAPACVVAYAHHPVLTGATVNTNITDMWELLANNGADLYVTGHAHWMGEYEPLDASLQPGPEAHLIELISGAAGHNLSPPHTDPEGRMEFSYGPGAGVLFLTLVGAANGGTATGFSWEWRALDGTPLRTASTTC